MFLIFIVKQDKVECWWLHLDLICESLKNQFVSSLLQSATSALIFFLSFLADIKKLYRLTGVDNKPTVFLFSDTQITDKSFLEDINNILSSGEVPNLYKQDEFVEVCVIFLFFYFHVCLHKPAGNTQAV